MTSLALARDISVAIPSDVYHDYQLFLQQRPPEDITDYSSPHSRRDVVEVVLFEQALRLGGWQGSLHFRQVDSYQRIQRLLQTGAVAASATTIFKRDIQATPELLASSAVVHNGEFAVGIYVRYSNPILHETALSKDAVQTLRVVSSKQWKVDWYTLQHSGFKNIINVPKWQSQVKLVDIGRADALLAPFQANEKMQLDAFNCTLLPIPEYKLVLQDSRHFVISAQVEGYQALYAALQQGLQLLRQQGRVTKAYQQAGFFNASLREWQLVN